MNKKAFDVASKASDLAKVLRYAGAAAEGFDERGRLHETPIVPRELEIAKCMCRINVSPFCRFCRALRDDVAQKYHERTRDVKRTSSCTHTSRCSLRVLHREPNQTKGNGVAWPLEKTV